MSDSHAEIGKHVKVYYIIGGILFALTVATVIVAGVAFGVKMAVIVGLLIAVVKGSLVALYFMHLSNERKLIYWILLLTAVFFFALIMLPLLNQLSSYQIGPLYVP